MAKNLVSQFTGFQKTLLGIALMCLFFHLLLKTDDAKQTFDFAYKYIRMANGFLGWACTVFSGWEGWRSKREVQKFVNEKIKRDGENE